MRIAVAGKGGVGKTTVAGTLARVIARTGRDVLAIDGDLSPNLGLTLGLDRATAAGLRGMPRGLAEWVHDELVLTKPFDEVVREHGVDTPDGVRLVLMGTPDHGGAG